MMILRRRYEWWWVMMALHRIGAIAVPATDQLLQKDIEYRTNAAEIKMIISYDNPAVQSEIEKALPNSPTVKNLLLSDLHAKAGLTSMLKLTSAFRNFRAR